jgi:glycyl-tRNA synthetase
MDASGDDLSYFDPAKNEKYVPYCIEPALGADRVMLAFLCDAYDEETLPDGDVRTVLHLHPALAPVKAAILPLSKKLGEAAFSLYETLSCRFECEYDDTASIGKRYRRQDEIGTPWCVTYDFQSLEDHQVTIRERDDMSQIRLPIADLAAWFEDKCLFEVAADPTPEMNKTI